MHSSTPGVPALLDLAPSAIRLLGDNLDLLGTIVSIIDGYLLLDAASLLQVCSPVLASVRGISQGI